MKYLGVLACAWWLGCGGGSSKAPAPATPQPEAPAVAVAPPAPPATLFQRLGGQPAITAVVDDFVTRLVTDDRIKDRFFNADAVNLKKLLGEQVCAASGGGCTYEGRDMTTTHAGMMLVDDEFNALVEDLVATLDKFKVPATEKGELLGALGPLKSQMVVDASMLHPMDAATATSVEKLVIIEPNVEAKRLLTAALTAGKRGQRSYAEQLFTRAEMLTGAKDVAALASAFRGGAPTRVMAEPKPLKDAGPQPKVVGDHDEDEVAVPKAKVTLHGTVKLDGKPVNGLAVVMLTPAAGHAAKRSPKQRIVEQRGREFAPHVLAVPVGSTVSFPNYDAIFHNVFSVSKTKSFDLGMYKAGQAREMKFDKPGIVRLGCNLHANMAAYVIVVDAPHYVVANAGQYAFQTLEPGKYDVRAWGESGGDPITATVDIKAGDNTADFDLVAGKAGLGTDKFGNAR